MKKETVRFFSSVLLAFILSLMLTVLTFLTVIRGTVQNRSFVARQLEKSDYYQQLKSEIAEEMATYSAIIGFDEAFFEAHLSDSDIRDPIISNLFTVYGEEAFFTYDKAAFSDALHAAFVAELTARGNEVSDELSASLQTLADNCADFYSPSARLPFVTTLSTLMRRINSAVRVGFLYASLLAVFCAAVLLFLGHSARFFSYACGGAFLTVTVPTAIAAASGVIARLSIADAATYSLIQHMAAGIGTRCLIGGGILLIAAVLFAIVGREKKEPPEAIGVIHRSM